MRARSLVDEDERMCLGDIKSKSLAVEYRIARIVSTLRITRSVRFMALVSASTWRILLLEYTVREQTSGLSERKRRGYGKEATL